MIAEQDYPNIKEIIVIDDGIPGLRLSEEEVQEVSSLFASTKVEFINLDHVVSIGAKRNEAARRATGDLIVHWDDDDIYGTRRISVSVEPIILGRANMTILTHSLTYFMDRDELYGAKNSSWGPHFGTLVWQSSLYDSLNGVVFPDTSTAEDYGFAQRAVKNGATIEVIHSLMAAERSEPLFIAMRHGSNTWEWASALEQNRFLGPEGAQLLPNSLMRRRDIAVYKAARSAGLPASLKQRVVDRGGVKNKKSDSSVKLSFFDSLYRGAGSFGAKDIQSAEAASSCCYDMNMSTIEYQKIAYEGEEFDIVSEFECGENGELGGQLGFDPTPIGADYGGVFRSPAGVMLTSNLTLNYYTRLTVNGDLNANGYSIHLSPVARLVVNGDLFGGNVLTALPQTAINVSGVLSFDEIYISGSGAWGPYYCNGDISVERNLLSSSLTASGGDGMHPIFLNVDGDLIIEKNFFFGPNFRYYYDGISTVTVKGVALIKEQASVSKSKAVFEKGVTAGSFDCGYCSNLYYSPYQELCGFGDITVTGNVNITDGSFVADQGFGGIAFTGDFYVSNSVIVNENSIVVGGSVWAQTMDIGNADTQVGTYAQVSIDGDADLMNLSIRKATAKFGANLILNGNYSSAGGGSLKVKGDFSSLSVVRFGDLAIGGVANVGHLTLGIEDDRSYGRMTVASSAVIDQIILYEECILEIAGSLTSRNITVGTSARLECSSNVMSEYVNIRPAGLILSGGMSTSDLRINSLGYLQSSDSPIYVSNLLELAPHYQLSCPGNMTYAGGSGCDDPFVDDSFYICPCSCQSNCVWSTHQPCELCMVSRHVCAHDLHPEDFEADWLFQGYFQANPGCIVGPDGSDMSLPSYDWNQAC